MTDERIRVAVATRDQRRIDEHFGQADTFDIYELTAGEATLVERRNVDDYGQEGVPEEDRRELILRAIADCRAVFAARIGDGPRQRLRKAAIVPVDEFAKEPVLDSLRVWGRERLKH